MKARALPLLTLVGLIALYATPVYAATAPTYFGPSFEVSATSPGGPAYLTFSAASSASYVAPPSSSGTPCPSGTTCGFPLQGCTNPAQFYYLIHDVTITDPNGNKYTLGSSATAGMYWPAILGGPPPGPSTNPLSDGLGNLGDALNLTLGDTFVMPFAAGSGGFTFTTSLGSPPETHAPEGPYYWWTDAGNVYGAGLRLDQNPSINPTLLGGTYSVNIAGTAVCSTGVQFGEVLQFGFGVSAPQFSGPTIAAVVMGFVAFMLVRRGRRLVSPAWLQS